MDRMTENKEAMVFGYFGYGSNDYCGQTVKTRTLYDLLKTKEGIHFSGLSFFDTYSLQERKLNIIKAFRSLKKADILYYLPASKSLLFIFPFLFLWSKIFNFKIHLIVIGGWLGDFLKKNPLHRWMLSRISVIYSETTLMKQVLEDTFEYKNVVLLHNFRNANFLTPDRTKDPFLRLVYLGRIHPLKGIETLFSLSEILEKKGHDHVIIDLYGPIFNEYEVAFNERLKHATSQLTYKGLLKPAEIHGILSEYDMLLLPTQYYTEGLPGSILDAYISGIPVLVTNWMYASEFVIEDATGIIVDFDDQETFVNQVLELVSHPKTIDRLKFSLLEERNFLSANHAWRTLEAQLYSKELS